MEVRPKSAESVVQTFLNAQEGRDFSVMAWQMSAAGEDKADSILPLFGEIEEGAIILDLGSGTGIVGEIIARRVRGVHVYSVDISQEYMERANEDMALTRLVYADVTTEFCPPDSVDGVFLSTVIHELESQKGGNGYRALVSGFNAIKPGDKIVARDFAKPERKEPIYMKIISDVGEDCPKDGKLEDIDYTRLSTRALLERFRLEFRGGGQFDYEEAEINGEKYIKILPEWAAEFYLRKDYVGNWRQELHEKYLHWTMKEAAQKLKDVGCINVEVFPDPNDWILKNRLYGKIALYEMDENGKLKEYDFPATHMKFVGTKPGAKMPVGKVVELPSVDYKELFASIKINKAEGVVEINGVKFEIADEEPLIGTKKSIFRLKNKPGQLLKVVRADTHNDHNVFKSMYQTIERQRVLREMSTPHLKVFDFDPNGPPYRYLIQEAAPEGAENAADLVRDGKLTETDIAQMAKIVNEYEKGKTWQLDTNPFSWFRVTKEDGATQMVYASSKVYRYDERWEFRRIGLLQWLNPQYVAHSQNYMAAIPRAKEYKELERFWPAGGEQIDLWKKYLDPAVSPS